ncbi:MAG: GPP34 family phosphoprotein [Alphaproteobacteria bacterium]|nr:GPP34 family phosphoprotein [Alphaproteobacteria bacterium]MBV8548729.1 GPP34 family phosphoprotein [Alphaproteobacteria bacterium]
MVDIPPLTILEEFVLLALDEATGAFHIVPRSRLDLATAGAVLMDLMRWRRLDYDLRNIYVTDVLPIGDDILDPILQMLAIAPQLTQHPIAEWIDLLTPEAMTLRVRALRRLDQRGIIHRENDKILWTYGERRYPVLADREVREVKARLLALCVDGALPLPADAALMALADSVGLMRLFMGDAVYEKARARIREVAKTDLIGQALAGLAAARAY